MVSLVGYGRFASIKGMAIFLPVGRRFVAFGHRLWLTYNRESEAGRTEK